MKQIVWQALRRWIRQEDEKAGEDDEVAKEEDEAAENKDAMCLFFWYKRSVNIKRTWSANTAHHYILLKTWKYAIIPNIILNNKIV